MHFLLTNDYSHVSPLFHLAIEFLETRGKLTIVAPKEEQSWTGKSVTRFSNLHVDEIKIHDHTAYCVDGTPAACVNLAIHSLMDERPDLVVSGINIGLNTGISFALSSGTLGACLEGNIAGIPGIALSQALDAETYACWNQYRELEDSTVAQLRHQLIPQLHQVADEILPDASVPSESITWNVNVPVEPRASSCLKRTRLARTCYGAIFERVGDQFRHNLAPVQIDKGDVTDEQAVLQGHVSLTRVDITDLGQM